MSITDTERVEEDKSKSLDAAQAEWDTVRTVEAGQCVSSDIHTS